MTIPWSNWSGSVHAAPQRFLCPTSEAELIALVARANRDGLTIRVAGTGHSFVPLCASDGLLLSLDGLQGVVSADCPALRATVWAGSKIYQLGEPLLAAGTSHPDLHTAARATGGREPAGTSHPDLHTAARATGGREPAGTSHPDLHTAARATGGREPAGMALENQGDIDRQAIAGAVSTGTHGTGPSMGSMSTQVAGLRIITASGEVVECSAEREPDIFQAARLSLGTLGVLSQITLRLLPAYRLHERTWVESFDDCLANLDAHIAATRHFEFFWSPREDACAMKSLQPTEAAEPPASERQAAGMPHPVDAERFGQGVGGHAPLTTPEAPGRLGRYLKSERVDWSYRIFPSERNVKFNECEFSLPAEHGPDAVREIRALMLGKHRDVQWPIEYRTLGADDIDLGTAYGRATVAISVHQAAELPYQPFFADVEAIFRNHHGRPHWGKWHSHTARELQALYPRWEHFLAVRARLDPHGRFLNPYLRGLLLG